MTFEHSIGAAENQFFRLEIRDAKKCQALQAQYADGDEIQAKATTAQESARGRAMMRRAVAAARKLAE